MSVTSDAVALATNFRKQSRCGRAMQVLRGVLAERYDPAAALEAARVLTAVDSYTDAWDLARAELDRYLDDVEALVLRSEIRGGLGHAAAAIDDASAATVLAPSHAPAWSQLAAARLVACDRAGSATAAREALRLDPNDVGALRGAAVLAEDAWPILRRAADRHAGDAERLATVAMCCVELEDLHEARRYVDRASAVDPDRDGVRIVNGWLHLLEGRSEDAVRIATQLLDELDSGAARGLRGCALMAEERYDEALAELDLAIAQYPAEVEALRVRGHVQFHRGQWADALRDASAVLDRRPDYVDARLLRVRARTAIDDHDAALRDITAVLAVDAGNADALTLRADIKLITGDAAGALVDVDRALMIGATNPDALLTRGLALMKLRRKSEAAEAFRSVLEIDSGNELAVQYLALATRPWWKHPMAQKATGAAVSVGGGALWIILGGLGGQ